MAARKSKSKSGDLKVKVVLNGWPAERRMLSNVEACWFVELHFTSSDGSIKTLRHFTTDDYSAALRKYEQLLVIFS